MATRDNVRGSLRSVHLAFSSPKPTLQTPDWHSMMRTHHPAWVSVQPTQSYDSSDTMWLNSWHIIHMHSSKNNGKAVKTQCGDLVDWNFQVCHVVLFI